MEWMAISEPMLPGQPMPVAPPAPWSVRRYMWVTVAAVAFTGLVFVGASLIPGERYFAIILAGLPLALLVAYSPEVGFYLFVLAVPFESLGEIGEFFSLLKPFGIFLMIVLVFHLIVKRRVTFHVGALWFAVAMVAFSLLTIFAAPSAEWFWVSVSTRMMLVGLLFMAVNTCVTREQALTFLWVLFLGAALVSIGVYFFPQRVAYTRVEEFVRPTIPGVGTNSHAKDLMPGLLLVPFLYKRSRGWVKAVVIVAMVLSAIGLLRTATRSVYIAVVIGFLVMALTVRGKSMAWRLLFIGGGVAVGAAVVVIAGVLGLYSVGAVYDRVLEIWQVGLRSGNRVGLYRLALELGATHPLLGVGPGGYYVEAIKAHLRNSNAHNDVLNAFAEGGIPGLLLYLGFLVAVLRSGWRATDPWLRSCAVALFVAAIVASLANSSFVLKGYWLHVAACVVAGTAFGPSSVAETVGTPVAAPAATVPQPVMSSGP